MVENLLQTEVGVFKSTQHSHKCDGSRTIGQVLDAIKNNPKKDLILKARKHGKSDNNKKYTIKSYGVKKQVNYYDYVKIAKTPSITWALNLKKGDIKRKKDIADDNLSGFIYYDIDSYENCTLNEIKTVLSKALSVFAVWKSFGGNGLGFLVYVKGLNKTNFVPTWEHYKKEFEKYIKNSINISDAGEDENASSAFVSLDPVTKDFTRLNILSYDPDIYISGLSRYLPLTAIKSLKRREKRKVNNLTKSCDINDEVVECHLEYVLKKWYHDGDCFNISEGRLTYYFYQRYFSECNLLGIELEDAFNYLIKSSNKKEYDSLFSHRGDSEIEQIGEKQYRTYSSQFNSWIENYDGHSDYIIENFNQKYVGTSHEINEILNYYYETLKKRYSSVNEPLIKRFSAKIKEKGILKRFLIEFLTNKKIKKELIDLAIETYNIPYIPFGLVLKHSVEGKKNSRLEKIIKQESLNKKTIEINFPRKIDSNFLVSIKPIKNIYLFADFFFKRANSFFISREDAVSSFITDFNNSTYSVLANVISKEIYFNEAAYRGLIFEKKIDSSKVMSFDRKYELKEDQYLSDLNLSFDKNSVIWSDTNSGKTTFICSNKSESKRLVLVPVIPLLKAIEHKHNVSVYYGLKKNIKRDSDIIICTYTSFPRLFGQLNEWGVLEQYELHVDEAHNFVTAASKGYRNKEMNFILEKIHYFKNVLLYTGTWINFLSPHIRDFNTIRIKKTRKKEFKRILYNDKLPCVEQLCDKNKLNVIYLQSKKEEKELGKYKKFFIEKGWNEDQMLFLNSAQKDNPEFEYVINMEKIKDNYNLVFCTSIAAEGLNIKDIKAYSLHFCTNESPHLIEQIVNRFRDHVPENIYLYKKKTDHEILPYSNLNMVEYQKQKIAATEKILSLVNHKDNIEFFKTLQKTDFMRYENNTYNMDYLSIAYSAYEHEKAYANNNIDYMIGSLREYGWEFKGDIILEDKIEKDLLKTLKQYRKAKGLQLDIKRREIFTFIKKNEDKATVELKTSEEAMLQFQKNAALPDYEITIRKRLLYFSRYMPWQDALDVTEYWVKDLKCSNSKLNILIKQLLIIKQEKSGYFDSALSINTKFFERLRSKYLDDKRLESSPAYLEGQLVNFVNKLGEDCEDFNKVNSFEEARNVIEQYFELSTILDKKGNVRYKFGAVKLANEAAEHYKKCKAFATYYNKTDDVFTKKDIKDYLLKIRKNLLYCAYYDSISEMSEKDALEVLNIYCDVKHKGKGKYKVTSIDPEMFKNIQWSFNIKNTNKEEEKQVLMFAI